MANGSTGPGSKPIHHPSNTSFWVSFGIRTGISAVGAYLASRDPNDPSTQSFDDALLTLRDSLNDAFPK